MRRTNTSATGNHNGPGSISIQEARPDGFTLVELLAVVVIMAIMMGLLVMSIRQVRGPAVQVASGQVASGLALARQLAIAKNTETRLVIASTTNGPRFPEEPYRYWTVISSNRNAANLWVMEKEWERLPIGTVFLNLASTNYMDRTWSPIPTNQIGRAYSPIFDPSQVQGHADTWRNMQSFTTNTTRIAFPHSPDDFAETWPTNLPYIGYNRCGGLRLSGMSSRLYLAGAGGTRCAGLRIVDGRSEATGSGTGQIIIESVDNARYVEAHDITGRVLIRKREDYAQ
jgi:prepilin-type N-terminal cleavage/methylation domain-containing protein